MRLPPPRATIALVGLTVAAWAVAAVRGRVGLEAAVAGGGFIPARFGSGALDAYLHDTYAGVLPAWVTPLSATLVHEDVLHIGFNMLLLGFCGRFVEAAIGSAGLVALYLVGAYAAALGQYLWDPASLVPMIGASGAASAVLGGYALLFGQRRATVAGPRLNLAINVAWLAAAWIGVQLLIGVAQAHGPRPVAVLAHIGGFLAGLALARPLLLWRYRKA